MTSWIVYPSPPTGNHRRVELAGLDLVLVPRIDNIFVYPDALDIDQFKDALSRTLSLWPLVAGRLLAQDDDHYFIEMSDNGIPVTFEENTEQEKWSLGNNVVIDVIKTSVASYFDVVQTMKFMQGCFDEPLLRLKLTRIVKSGEWILATSWAHVLGDASSNVHFLTTLSCLYQRLEPKCSSPIFERRLWREDEADFALSPLLKELNNAIPMRQMMELYLNQVETYEQLNLHFSSEQCSRLRQLVNDNTLSKQDILTAYIILLFNEHCFKNDNERLLLRTNMVINFRGVSNSIAPNELIANAAIVLLSEQFDNPYSLSSVAKVIRRSINQARDPKFLEPCVATADALFRKIKREHLSYNIGPFANDITVNSNLRYDWAHLVDFGYSDQCRFYTPWTGRMYFRVFHLNPIQTDNGWLPRDLDGAEIAFRIAPDVKDKFIEAWQKDIAENFSNVPL